jgi:hypothetical protein
VLLPCLVAASSLLQRGVLLAGARGKSEGVAVFGMQGGLVCVAWHVIMFMARDWSV